jgi:hypothetical protein
LLPFLFNVFISELKKTSRTLLELCHFVFAAIAAGKHALDVNSTFGAKTTQAIAA